jgi:hypothetical protein
LPERLDSDERRVETEHEPDDRAVEPVVVREQDYHIGNCRDPAREHPAVVIEDEAMGDARQVGRQEDRNRKKPCDSAQDRFRRQQV